MASWFIETNPLSPKIPSYTLRELKAETILTDVKVSTEKLEELGHVKEAKAKTAQEICTKMIDHGDKI